MIKSFTMKCGWRHKQALYLVCCRLVLNIVIKYWKPSNNLKILIIPLFTYHDLWCPYKIFTVNQRIKEKYNTAYFLVSNLQEAS